MVTKHQIASIIKAIKIGRQIAEEFSEVREAYFSGSTFRDIVKNFRIESFYSCTEQVARAALSHAMGGFDGGYGEDSYIGLITNPYELEMMEKRHRVDSGTITSDRLRREGRDISVIVTTEEKRKAAITATKNRNQVPWTESRTNESGEIIISELDYVAQCYSSSNFLYTSGNHRGMANVGMIREATNDKYHGGRNVRSNRAIILAGIKLRKKDNDNKIKERKSEHNEEYGPQPLEPKEAA